MPGATLQLVTPQAQAAGSRSALYKALAKGFRTPSSDDELATGDDELATGAILAELRQAIAGLPYALADVGGEYGTPCFLPG